MTPSVFLNKRIALLGPGGAGKTTLAQILHDKTGLPVISESIRAAMLEIKTPIRDDIDEGSRLVLQTVALMKQKSLEALHSITGFVSDRSRIDALAYTEAFGICNAAYRSLALEGVDYDLLVYVPPFSEEVEDDGVRIVDGELREAEERACEIMKDLLSAYFPKHLILESSSVDHRVQEIQTVMLSKKFTMSVSSERYG